MNGKQHWKCELRREGTLDTANHDQVSLLSIYIIMMITKSDGNLILRAEAYVLSSSLHAFVPNTIRILFMQINRI